MITDILFAVLFGMGLVWLILVRELFSRLENMHPQKYESMGRPSLFSRNNIATGMATTKFLFAREHRFLNDTYLSKLCDLMVIFFVAYLILFIILIVDISAPRAA